MKVKIYIVLLELNIGDSFLHRDTGSFFVSIRLVTSLKYGSPEKVLVTKGGI